MPATSPLAILAIFLGGGLGSLCRYGASYWIDARWLAASPYPWGIFVVNATGCFLFGWLYAFSESREWFGEVAKVAVFAGFLGGLTTFSTFSWQTLDLIRTGHLAAACLNGGGSVVLGLFAVWAGLAAGR